MLKPDRIRFFTNEGFTSGDDTTMTSEVGRRVSFRKRKPYSVKDGHRGSKFSMDCSRETSRVYYLPDPYPTIPHSLSFLSVDFHFMSSVLDKSTCKKSSETIYPIMKRNLKLS